MKNIKYYLKPERFKDESYATYKNRRLLGNLIIKNRLRDGDTYIHEHPLPQQLENSEGEIVVVQPPRVPYRKSW